MAKDKIRTKQMDIPYIDGTEIVFIAAICVDEKGKASITYNALDGVNMAKISEALQQFGKDIASCGPAHQA